MYVSHMSTAERKEREKAMRSDAIVQAAEKLFFSRGFESVTMDDIAKEAELAKGTLYLYFDKKEDLYFAIVLRGFRIMNAMFKEAVSAKKTGLDKAYAIGVAFYDFLKKHPDYFKAFDQMTCERLESVGDETAAEIDRLNRGALDLLAGSIAAGIEDGSIRRDVDPVKTAIFLIEASQAMITLPMGFDKALGNLGIEHDDLVRYSLGLMRRSIANRSDEA